MDLNAIQENERKWRDFLSSIKSFKHGPSNSININTKRNVSCLATEFANKLLKKKGGTVQFTGTQDVLIRYKHLDVRNETLSPKSIQPLKDIQLMKAETSPKAEKSKICIAAQPENEFVRPDLLLEMDTNDVMELSDDDNNISLLGSNKDSVPKQDHLGTIFDNENSLNHSNEFEHYIPKKIRRSEKPTEKDVEEFPNVIQMNVDNVGQVKGNIEIPTSRKPDDKDKEEIHNFIRKTHPDVSNETFTPKSKQPINDIQLAKAEPLSNAAKINIFIAATTENELIGPKLSLEMNTKDVVHLSDNDKSISLLGSNKDSALKQDHLGRVFDNETSFNHSEDSDYYTQKKIPTSRKPNDNEKEETCNFILYNHLDVRNEPFTPKLTQEVQFTKAKNLPKAEKSEICIAAKPENEFVHPGLSLEMNAKDVMELFDNDNSFSLLRSNKDSALKHDHVEIVFDNENLSNHSDDMNTKDVIELSDDENSINLLVSNKDSALKQNHLGTVFDNENSSNHSNDFDNYILKKIPGSEKPNDKDVEEIPNFIQLSVENVGQVEGNIEIQRVRDRDKLARSVKNDIDKPCSKWTVSSIAEYFIFDECVTRLIFPHNYSLSLDATYELIQKDILKRLEVVKGSPPRKGKGYNFSEILTKLKSISNTETGARIILDALLIPVCSALDLQIEVDKNINCNFLPNCRFDYCILKNNQIIGCVEAKSIKSLNDSSVAQALLQLTILQTALIVNEIKSSRDSDFPVFAIVTDGHRFIYIQLKGSSLGFEHENGKVRVREVTRECDFKSIMQHITFLVNGTEQIEDDIITID